ncbi:hypothetical protein F3Y22_tig00110057pilonHSYRG00068 [Hibiscus syriacus]|uniref:RING-type E3 ubiquitin transferase n=1 Tax=Hibiscus syriacus TaxID=106335 RepID=A0A6A3BQG2_HIBSY|nr:hypothetical protein F3Y22_tig00110057pilonHSYRG00068 [Hibiscus syriacus]
MGSFQPFFFFIIVFFCFEPSRSFDTCVTQCGSLIIRFPFMLIGQPQHCGFHGFNLSCQHQAPILTLPYVGNFSVDQIDYTQQFLQVRYSQGCLSGILVRGLNLSGSPFTQRFTQNYTFYNCPAKATTRLYPGVVQIPCLSGLSFYVVVVRSNIDIPSTSVCAEIATVPVPYSDTTDWLNDVMTLEWTEPDCRRCESRKRTCLPDNVSTVLHVRCDGAKRKRLPPSVKYGLLFGLGAPLVCLMAIMSCVKINLTERQHHLDDNILMTSVTGRGLPRSTPGATNGLNRLAIDAYPTSSVGPSRRLPNPNDNVCSICLCEYQADEMLKTIPKCNHYFHVDCIVQWLKLNATCPICRDKFEEPASLALSSEKPVVGLSI